VTRIKILRNFVLASTLSGLVLVTAFATDSPLRLSTADTVITLSAGPEGPGVLSLASPGGETWTDHRAQSLIEKAQWNGTWQPVHWKLASVDRDRQGRSLTVVYECNHPHLRLLWLWQARDSSGPVEHTIKIENLESRPVALPLQDSLSFNWSVPASKPLCQMWIDKGAGKPTATGTHRVAISDGYRWEGTSSSYAPDGPDESRETIPWMLVEATDEPHSGWYLGIEFSGRTSLSLAREGSTLAGKAGLNPSPGSFITQVPGAGSFTTPTVFLGAFSGGSEAAGIVLRRWVARVLLNAADMKSPSYPLLAENSWGEGMEINEERAQSMIADAARLGLEMFHLDAGWFRGVGDWYPHPQRFPHGIAALADRAHHVGLKFGMWVDWTQAGTSTDPGALNVHDPRTRNWLTRDVPADWKPAPFKGVTIDIGYAPARAWCARELNRLVRDDHLDMLEHDGYLVAEGCTRGDHPHASCARSLLGPEPWLIGSNSTDVSYHAAKAYYQLYENLRLKYPHLLLEACNDGGRMIDFGTAAHTDYFSITDSYDPLSNRRAFYDASHVLPAPMLECYVEKYPARDLANFTYALRSGMMGWCTIMQDTTTWTVEQHRAAQRAFQLYKTRLRPLIRSGDLYHVSARPDGVHWDALEYFSPDRKQGVVYVFRGSTPTQKEDTFLLEGLQPGSQYQVDFEDHPSENRRVSGHELMRRGLAVSLPEPESSELVFITEIRSD